MVIHQVVFEPLRDSARSVIDKAEEFEDFDSRHFNQMDRADNSDARPWRPLNCRSVRKFGFIRVRLAQPGAQVPRALRALSWSAPRRNQQVLVPRHIKARRCRRIVRLVIPPR